MGKTFKQRHDSRNGATTRRNTIQQKHWFMILYVASLRRRVKIGAFVPACPRGANFIYR
jgi:hypothetical protein